MARCGAMFDLDKDQNILVIHHKIKLSAFYMVIVGDQAKAVLLQPLSG